MDPGGFACRRLGLCVETWRERSEAGAGRPKAVAAGGREAVRAGGARRRPEAAAFLGSSAAQAAETLVRVIRRWLLGGRHCFKLRSVDVGKTSPLFSFLLVVDSRAWCSREPLPCAAALSHGPRSF